MSTNVNGPKYSIDNRKTNTFFEATSHYEYLQKYASNLEAAILQVDPKALDATIDLAIATVKRSGQMFVGGNGGSAAIADHLCCDFTKGARPSTGATLRTQSLVSNASMLTALANDFGFENSLSLQLEMLAQPGDALILISSSGSSKNILAAAHKAKQIGLPLIGFTGFEGGELKKLADISIHIPYSNYGIVEDSHQMLMHVIAQRLLIELNK